VPQDYELYHVGPGDKTNTTLTKSKTLFGTGFEEAIPSPQLGYLRRRGPNKEHNRTHTKGSSKESF